MRQGARTKEAIEVRFRTILLTWVAVLSGAALLAGCGSENEVEAAAAAGQARAGADKQVTIGYVDWTEAVAVSHLMKTLLEDHFGYDVRLRLMDVEEVFNGVASGEIDAFLDVWLPNTHRTYWQQYRDQVVDLGSWYGGGATLGIAVPDYVDAQSIADLEGRAERFGGEIVGIGRGAGIMRITEQQVMPSYGLESYQLKATSTAKMIESLDQAIEKRRPIAITAWKPHWMFTAYPIRYLEDPKNTMGGVEELHAIARQGLAEDAPSAYRLLDSFHLTEAQLGSLELAIADARSVHGGVQDWLADHMSVVTPWFAAASEGRGGHPY